MKTLIIYILIGCMFSANIASAQHSKRNMLPVVNITGSGPNLNSNVRKAFERSFKNAEKIQWFRVNQNYTVKFIEDEQIHSALYRQNGELIYHIAYGNQANLPINLLGQVKSGYKNFSIARVFSINQDNRTVWVVNLENKEYMVMARLEDNSIVEVNRLVNVTAPSTTAQN